MQMPRLSPSRTHQIVMTAIKMAERTNHGITAAIKEFAGRPRAREKMAATRLACNRGRSQGAEDFPEASKPKGSAAVGCNDGAKIEPLSCLELQFRVAMNVPSRSCCTTYSGGFQSGTLFQDSSLVLLSKTAPTPPLSGCKRDESRSSINPTWTIRTFFGSSL